MQLGQLEDCQIHRVPGLFAHTPRMPSKRGVERAQLGVSRTHGGVQRKSLNAKPRLNSMPQHSTLTQHLKHRTLNTAGSSLLVYGVYASCGNHVSLPGYRSASLLKFEIMITCCCVKRQAASGARFHMLIEGKKPCCVLQNPGDQHAKSATMTNESNERNTACNSTLGM